MGGKNVKNTMIDNVLEIVAPHLCSGCDKTGTLLCNHCKYDIINAFSNVCLFCNETSLKGICLNHQTYYQQVWVAGARRGPLQRLIDGFKFQHMKAAARSLADLLDKRLPELPSSTILVPIPTVSSHIRERGYDHMLLVAQYFAALRGFPLQRLLIRNNTATQHIASREKRLEQAASAFVFQGVINPQVPYLILDDVVTTGSTLENASRVLASAGAQSIWVGALARQPLD
jgi:ComF family protein